MILLFGGMFFLFCFIGIKQIFLIYHLLYWKVSHVPIKSHVYLCVYKRTLLKCGETSSVLFTFFSNYICVRSLEIFHTTQTLHFFHFPPFISVWITSVDMLLNIMTLSWAVSNLLTSPYCKISHVGHSFLLLLFPSRLSCVACLFQYILWYICHSDLQFPI